MAGEVLRVTAGNAAGSEIQLEGELLLGRGAGGQGSLAGDEELSREHARVYRGETGEILIEDLGSTNGTFVNGERIAGPTTVAPGDAIRVGASTLEVAASPATTAQPTDVRPVEPAPPAEPAAPPGPPPGVGPPPGMGAPPPGAGPPPGVGPPPGMGAPPPGAGPPEGMQGPPPGFAPGAGGKLPPAIAGRIRRMAILAAVVGFVIGFGIATLVWQVLT